MLNSYQYNICECIQSLKFNQYLTYHYTHTKQLNVYIRLQLHVPSMYLRYSIHDSYYNKI